MNTRVYACCVLLISLTLLTALPALYALELVIGNGELLTEMLAENTPEIFMSESISLVTIRNIVLACATGSLLVLVSLSYILLRRYIAPLGAAPWQIIDLVSQLRVTDYEAGSKYDREDLHGLFGALVDVQRELQNDKRKHEKIESVSVVVQDEKRHLGEKMACLESKIAILEMQDNQDQPERIQKHEEDLANLLEILRLRLPVI